MAIRTVFANESGNQPASQLDNMYGDVWNAATIPCTPSGTNAITLTPQTNANLPTAYNQHQRVAFTAGATSTGAVTAQIGSLGFLSVYLPGGTQANANAIISGSYYELAYDPALNASAGGWWLVIGTQTPVMQLLNVLTASNSASLSDTTSLTSAFSSYEIELQDLIPATNAVVCHLLVQSGGVFQTSGYLSNSLAWSATSTAAQAPTTYVPLSNAATSDVSNNSSGGLSGVIRVHNPSASSVPVKFTGQVNYLNSSAAGEGAVVAGFYNTAAAVTGFEVLFSAGNITSGIIRVYGIL